MRGSERYLQQSTPTGKQPYYFSTENGSPLTIAGVWDEWKDIETEVPLRSCTMIITTANEFVGRIHDRMPALLTPYQFDSWLFRRRGPGVAQALGSEVTADVSGVAESEQLEGGGRRSDVD